MTIDTTPADATDSSGTDTSRAAAPEPDDAPSGARARRHRRVRTAALIVGAPLLVAIIGYVAFLQFKPYIYAGTVMQSPTAAPSMEGLVVRRRFAGRHRRVRRRRRADLLRLHALPRRVPGNTGQGREGPRSARWRCGARPRDDGVGRPRTRHPAGDRRLRGVVRSVLPRGHREPRGDRPGDRPVRGVLGPRARTSATATTQSTTPPP